jgi:malonate transporter and related proteins
MIELILGALLPVMTVLGLGYFAGWHRDFGANEASILTRMVLLYALPLLLFAGTASIPRKELLVQLPLALTIMLGIVIPFIVTLAVGHLVFRRDFGTASLRALAVASPAVPFVGTSVLGTLFGSAAPEVPVAVSTLVLNLLLIPVTVFLLSKAAGTTDSGASAKLLDQLRNTVREPIVWAPFGALLFALIGIPLPAMVKDALLLLGQTAGGVALFACGVLLFSYKIFFTLPVAILTIARTVIVPAITWAVLHAVGISSELLRVSVLTLGFPVMAVVAILAVRFHRSEQEMASVVLFCNASWIVATGAFILMT